MYGMFCAHQRLYARTWVANALSGVDALYALYSDEDSGISLATKPIWTLTVVVAPAAIVTDRVRAPLAAAKPSPLSRGNIVVSPFLTVTWPVNSEPLPDVAYGEATLRGKVADPVPVLVTARLSTATS